MYVHARSHTSPANSASFFLAKVVILFLFFVCGKSAYVQHVSISCTCAVEVDRGQIIPNEEGSIPFGTPLGTLCVCVFLLFAFSVIAVYMHC